MTHSFSTRIYYEDTDAAGIVYYANYLKFAERARTEWLRELGLEQSQLLDSDGIGFVVRRVEADFLSPARLDDLITVETHLQELRKVRMTMRQAIMRGTTPLALLHVVLACVNRHHKPVRFPDALMNPLNQHAAHPGSGEAGRPSQP